MKNSFGILAIFLASFFVFFACKNTGGDSDRDGGAAKKIWYVNPKLAASGAGDSFANGFLTMQEAVDAANEGDSIYILAGEYKLGEQEQFLKITKSSLRLVGGFTIDNKSEAERDPENKTVLNGEGKKQGIEINGAHSVALVGLNVINMTSTDKISWSALIASTNPDKGIRSNNLLIEKCSFESNETKDIHMSPIQLYDADNTRILSSVFRQNKSNTMGGAIQFYNVKNAEIAETRFIGNIARQWGGAIDIHGSFPINIHDSWFQHNESELGGAIHLDSNNVTLTSNEFFKNQAKNGGAIASENAQSLSLVSNSFKENTATADGKNLYLKRTSGIARENKNLENNTIAKDRSDNFIVE